MRGTTTPAVATMLLAAISLIACGAKKEPPPNEPAPLVIGSTSASTSATTPTASTSNDEPAPPPGTLYARLGGRGRLLRIVDSLVTAIDNDPKLHARFAPLFGSSKKEAFKALLFDQLCEATGGTCKYRGRSMKEAHAGLKITEPEWNAFMLALDNALDDNQVGETERLDLLSVLAPMRLDIIDVAAGRRRR